MSERKPYIAGEHFTVVGGIAHWNLTGYTRLRTEGLWTGETSDEPPSVEAILSGNTGTTTTPPVIPSAGRTSNQPPVTRALPGYARGREVALRVLGKSTEPRRQGSARYERGRRIALKALGKEAS